MQIQLRVRTNDVDFENSSNQIAHNSFMLFDNCTEVKYGTALKVDENKFKEITHQYLEVSKNKLYNIHPETYTAFAEVFFMVRSVEATNARIAEETKKTVSKSKSNEEISVESPYHYNVIEWKDRINGKRYRLIYDTIIFLMDDTGRTLKKIEG